MRLRKPGSRVSQGSGPSARERAAARAERKSKVAQPAGRREATKDRFTGWRGTAKRTGTEVLGITRELLRIPAAFYMRVAERAGGWVLAGWLWLWPYLVRLWHLLGRGLAWAERTLTPARVTVAVAFLTCAALAGSQWADLSSVSVGVDAYRGVEDVAPAPDVATKTVGETHSWIGIPLAIAAALIVFASARGRPKLAWLLVPVGVAVIAISVLVDRPEGLDEGSNAVAYDSVTANLLPGFWAQLVSGVVLILLSFMLVRVLKPGAATTRTGADGSPERRSPSARGGGRTAEATR